MTLDAIAANFWVLGAQVLCERGAQNYGLAATASLLESWTEHSCGARPTFFGAGCTKLCLAAARKSTDSQRVQVFNTLG